MHLNYMNNLLKSGLNEYFHVYNIVYYNNIK